MVNDLVINYSGSGTGCNGGGIPGVAGGSGGAVGLESVRVQTVHRTRAPDEPSAARPDDLSVVRQHRSHRVQGGVRKPDAVRHLHVD